MKPGEQRRGLKGNFWEKPNSAISYRAEQLCVCAIHHLIAALASFYKIEKCTTKIWCDNMGPGRVCPGASCADILRNIRNTRNRIHATIKYDHVDGHMDKYLLFTQMTLEQQMNYVCDREANKAVGRSMVQRFLIEEKWLLPGEDIAVFAGGKKLTSDLSRAI